MPTGVSFLWQMSKTASPLRRSSTGWAECNISRQSFEGASSKGGADSDVRGASRPTTPELTDEEVSALCDIETDGSTQSHKQPVVQNLVERGLVVPSEEPLARVKLTALAQQRLSKRGVGK
jgi:hypothetical protein